MKSEVDRELEKRQLLEGLFKRKCGADYWAMCASNLWQAAEVLFSVYKSSTTKDGEPIHDENTELNVPATLLYGYATENAIKGLLVKKLNLDVSHLGSYDRRKEWMGHDLVALLGETGIPASETENLILGTLTQYILWAGKYPVSKTFERFVLQTQYEHEAATPARNCPPVPINVLMRFELEKLFRALLGEIRKPHRR